MHDPLDRASPELAFLDRMARSTGRRQFLQWSGLTLGVMALGCGGDDVAGPGDDVNLGTGDTAVLNYAYVLEQLEADFYTRVSADLYAGVSAEETQMLRDIRDHEVIHRDFLRQALGDAAVGELSFTYGSLDFGSRAAVLTAARTFEDLGVAAYNGAGALLASADLLLVAGKIVSVEARHAAAIRQTLEPGTAAFAGDDVVDTNGLDGALAPSAVLAAAATYVEADIVSSLP